jgi:hypothetical protein
MVVARYVMSGGRLDWHDADLNSRKRMDWHRATKLGLSVDGRRWFRRTRRLDRNGLRRQYDRCQLRFQLGRQFRIRLRLGQRFSLGFRGRLAVGRWRWLGHGIRRWIRRWFR